MTSFDIFLIIGIQFATIIALLLPPYLFWIRPKIRFGTELIFAAVVIVIRMQLDWHLVSVMIRFSLAGYIAIVISIVAILGVPQYLLWRHLKRKEQNSP